jgi:hypothetical protein
MAGLMDMYDIFHGNVRWNPVGISLFKEEAQVLIRKTPKEILEMAIGNTEDYAEEQGYTLITRAVMEEQMRSIGIDPAMLG